MSDAERLGAEITELCSQIYAAEYRLLELIREFDEKEYWGALGLCSCAHWLNLKCGIGMNAARERVRVAHALAELPKISAGFARGELSYSKVRAITRIADAKNEDYLLMLAEHGTAHHVEKVVSKYRRVKGLQDAEHIDADYRDRELTHYYDHDGCLVIKARLPAEQGALVVKALGMVMDKGFRAAGSGQAEAGDDVTAETSVAESTVTAETSVAESTVTAETFPAGSTVTAETSGREPVAARRADALAEIAESYMNNSESSGSTADRYQVVLHVSEQTLQKNHGQHVTAVTSHIDDGPGVTAETSRRIGCDCSVVPMVMAPGMLDAGEPMSIGRRSRTIPPPMRRALGVRDGGCRFPGCTHTRFVDGHHIKHWADGGETSLANLVLLCRHHHRLVHEGGFSCEKSADGEVFFKDRSANRLSHYLELPGIDTEDVDRWLDNAFFDPRIRPDACTAKWCGERMDYEMAVSALMT